MSSCPASPTGKHRAEQNWLQHDPEDLADDPAVGLTGLSEYADKICVDCGEIMARRGLYRRP